MKRFLCRVGIHDWELIQKAHYASPLAVKLALPSSNAVRRCKCCDKEQYQDIHCLGLNPPEYIKTWVTQRG